MPENKQKSINHLHLFGEVEAFREPSKQTYKVHIEGLKGWVFDLHFEDRGIWVQSRDAWYKLKKPCNKLVILPNGEQSSQEILHQSLRAKCGLMNNLLDMMSNKNGTLDFSYLMYHSKQNPFASYSVLYASEEELKQNPNICNDPFDMELLKRASKFVKTHFEGADSNFKKTCTFMKGLTSLSNDFESAKKRSDTWAIQPFDYICSAEFSEQRSNRYPWGCLRLDDEGTFEFLFDQFFENHF